MATSSSSYILEFIFILLKTHIEDFSETKVGPLSELHLNSPSKVAAITKSRNVIK